MGEGQQELIRQRIDEIYRQESQRVFATLVRLLGDFDVAEEAVQDAFAAAVRQWAHEGMPANPRAWLISAGRFKAIDSIRRRARLDSTLLELAQRVETASREPVEAQDVVDDRLRLIFTCCHPALAPTIQVALTLREVCGLTTEEVANAFLTSPTTMAQRIVRGKAKIRHAGIPYQIPTRADLPERLEAVLSIIYLVFNEGYSASSGEQQLRIDLVEEAIRLGRLLVELMPDPEAVGLLALMLLHDSRRRARVTSEGDIILLEAQDRTQWDHAQITEGIGLVQRAWQSEPLGAYTIQAAISAVHAAAATASETDWAQIVSLYDLLQRATPSPIVDLNRAVAIAMRDGPESGLAIINQLLTDGQLADYHLAHAARADLYRRMGNVQEARKSYTQALALAKQSPEIRFLTKRLDELSG